MWTVREHEIFPALLHQFRAAEDGVPVINDQLCFNQAGVREARAAVPVRAPHRANRELTQLTHSTTVQDRRDDALYVTRMQRFGLLERAVSECHAQLG